MATKIDLINKIHKQLDYLSKEDVSDSVNLILDYLSNSLKEQNRIEIRNFGNFSIRTRKFPESDKFYNTIYKHYIHGASPVVFMCLYKLEKATIYSRPLIHAACKFCCIKKVSFIYCRLVVLVSKSYYLSPPSKFLIYL